MLKHSPKLLSFIYSTLAFLGLFATSCSTQDHVVPETPVETMITTVGSNSFQLFTANIVEYQVKFVSLGAVPVVEYGVVRVLQEVGGADLIPTINDKKVICTNSADLNIQEAAEGLDSNLNRKIFYRAYAILENGKIIYGETKSRMNIVDNPVAPKITTLDASVSSGFVKFGVRLTEFGTVPITEYGVVYRIGATEIPSAAPTENDQKVVFPEPSLYNLDPKFHDSVIDLIPASFIHYRAYAKLLDGTTIYGEVKTIGTLPE